MEFRFSCDWDGGDCDEFKVLYPGCKAVETKWIGDRIRDGGEYNSEVCGWDGGDCDPSPLDEFNVLYPNCEVSETSWVGDGFCDGEEFNVTECAFDGGDCL